jgi:hypothetical protein
VSAGEVPFAETDDDAAPDWRTVEVQDETVEQLRRLLFAPHAAPVSTTTR